MPTTLEVYERAIELAQASSWPGFDFGTIPIAIYDGKETRLFCAESCPPGFSQVIDCARNYVLAGQHELMVGSTAREFDGRYTAIVSIPDLDKELMALEPDYPSAVAVHEAFHVYQHMLHPEWGFPVGDHFKYPRSDVAALRFRLLELVALDAALKSSDNSIMQTWLALALSIRNSRQEYSALCVELDKVLEWFEGIPYYLELFARGQSNVDAPLLEEIKLPGQHLRQGYCAGAQYGLLLRRVNPDWARFLEESPKSSLAEIAQSLIDPDAAVASFSSFQEALASTQAGNAVNRLVMQFNEHHDAARFREGYTLVICGRSLMDVCWYNPLQAYWSGQQMVHNQRLTLKGDWGSITVEGRPCITIGPSEADPLCKGVERIIISGVGALSESLFGDNKFQYEEDGVRIDVLRDDGKIRSKRLAWVRVAN